jgi:gliding motility-associated-like protein
MYRTLRFFVLTMLMLGGAISHQLQAQLIVSDTLTVNQRIQGLIGAGVEISNITITCDTTLSVREFDGSLSNLGLTNGLLMSTGEADSAVGPNNYAGHTGISSGLNYPPLDALANNGTFDACVIAFDIVPSCDSIGIRYVFASEEYNEFVNSTFNDVFAFFISGPGFPAPAPGNNIALIPNSAIPVAINNVNNGQAAANQVSAGPCTNCAYYVDNVGGTDIEYDGLTTPLLATASVVPCQTYRITLAVADAGDQVLDSGVFLEASGVSCLTGFREITATNNVTGGDAVFVESCSPTGFFSLTFNEPLENTTTLPIAYGGTATPGVDYNPLPSSVIIPAGQSSALFPISIINDTIVEGIENILIIFNDTSICGTVYRDTAVVQILDAPEVPDIPDTVLCSDAILTPGVPTLPGLNYQWSPGGGFSDSTVSDPLLTVLNPDSVVDTVEYIFTVFVGQNICPVSDTFEVQVYPDTLARLQVSPSVACSNVAIQFSFDSLVTGLSVQQWDFGDGSSSTATAPQHSYATQGSYPIQLVVENAFGCIDTLVDTVQILPTPDAGFAVDSVCAGDTSFLVMNNGPQPGLNYQWDLGNGSSIDVPEPFEIYGSADTFSVTLVLTNAGGCADTFSQPAIVHPNPSAAFTGDNICEDELATLLDQSSQGAGPITSYTWLFADGTTASGTTVQRGFTQAGPEAISLIITDVFGCTDSVGDTIEVFARPQADFVSDSVCLNQPLTFTDRSTSSQPPIQAWEWDFGDATTDSTTSPTHIYGAPGVYTVTLVVTDAEGCRDTTGRSALVGELPDPSFTVEPECLGFASQFDAGAPIAGETYAWDFGDNGSSTQANPNYQYGSSGDFIVQLVVTNAFGCQDSSSDTSQIYRLPVADFTAEAACQGNLMTFDNQSSEGDFPLVAYDWAFGDASAPSSLTDPTHIYEEYGQRTVALQITDAFGCTADTAKPVQVWARPLVDFVSDTACAEAEVAFFDQSTVPDGSAISARRWDLGNGDSREGEKVETFYPASGSYDVELLVITEHGCRDSLTRNALVYPLPQLSFDYESTCALDTTFFTSSVSIDSSIAGDVVNRWSWDWGDGTQSGALVNPGHLYGRYGDYVVILSAVSQRGCENSLLRIVPIYRLPETPRIFPDTACFGDAAFLSATARFSADELAWYYAYDDEVSFQAGNSLVTPNLTESISYYVESFSPEGCISQRVVLTAEVHPDAAPELIADADIVERPDAIVNFKVGSQIPMSSYAWNFDDGQRSSGPEPAHTFAQKGIYTVSVDLMDKNGCEYRLSRNIEVKELINVLVPSAFTPNGDGKNDNFFIGQTLMRDLDFVVYNRWGREIFATNSIDFQWDGRDQQGNPVPEGVYTYRLRSRDIDGRVTRKAGTITLLR